MSKIEVELQEVMGSDYAVANAAWTSTYDKDRREEKYEDPDKVKALIFKMAEQGHSTPFESIIFRFWIRMPIFTDRQHMTHRIASHNGLSGRYRTMPSDWFDLPEDVIKILMDVNTNHVTEIVNEYHALLQHQQHFYNKWLIDLKQAEDDKIISNEERKRVREVLRGVLGTSTMTERTTIFNLRSFANYQRLRNSDHAQPEIKEVAVKMLQAIKTYGEGPHLCDVKYSIEALEKVGWKI